LKEDWNFNGFVISDADAVNIATVLHFTSTDNAAAGQQAINGGLDVIFQTDLCALQYMFIRPFLDGGIDRQADRRCRVPGC
jgi:beta-glucosidase